MTAIPREQHNRDPHNFVANPRRSGRIRSDDARLILSVERPRPGLIILKASGAIDSTNVPRFSEVLRSRLGSITRVIMLDLTAVTFLGADAIVALSRAQRHAEATGKLLSLLTGVRAVDRPLEVLGFAGQFLYGRCPDGRSPAFGSDESEQTVVEVPDRVRTSPRSPRGESSSCNPSLSPN